MDSVVNGTLTCHASSLAVITEQIGFVPSRIEIWNPLRDVKLIWTDSMPDNSALKICTANGCLQSAGLAIGSTKTQVYNGAFNFRIAGVWYTKTATAAGTAVTATTIPSTKFGAFGFEIGADGTIDKLDASGNATGYATAALALAAWDATAVSASHVKMGCVVVTSTAAGGFVGATDNFDDTGVTAVYYNDMITYSRRLGITPVNDNVTGQGISLAVDTDLQALGHTLYYTAWRR